MGTAVAGWRQTEVRVKVFTHGGRVAESARRCELVDSQVGRLQQSSCLGQTARALPEIARRYRALGYDLVALE